MSLHRSRIPGVFGLRDTTWKFWFLGQKVGAAQCTFRAAPALPNLGLTIPDQMLAGKYRTRMGVDWIVACVLQEQRAVARTLPRRIERGASFGGREWPSIESAVKMRAHVFRFSDCRLHCAFDGIFGSSIIRARNARTSCSWSKKGPVNVLAVSENQPSQ